MAAPDVSYSNLRQVAHDQGVGFKWRGFEITAKELLGPQQDDRTIWIVTVTRSGNVWTVVYTTSATGTVGKVYQVQDDEGRWWYWDLADGWR